MKLKDGTCAFPVAPRLLVPRTLFLMCSLLCLMTNAPALADSVILQPIADTSIFEAFPDNNLGANENLVAGANANLQRGRALIRFDIAGAIPSNAIIESVSLTITVVITPPGGGASSIFDLRRLLVSWGEGAGTGNAGLAANPGEATWNARFFPSNLWSMPGGSISNDISQGVSASLLLPDLGTYTFASTSNLVSDVQAWLQVPATNFGWILMSESEDTAFTVRRIGSRESTNAPSLMVQFAVPSTIITQTIEALDGNIRLSFQVVGGKSYSVQYRQSLSSGNWLTLTNLGLQTVATNMLVLDPIGSNSQRFYRITAF